MFFTRSILVSAFLAILLIGCKKAETPPTPELGATTDSVAPSTSAMPPSDATMPPAALGAGTGSGDAQGATQVSPKELTPVEESAAMPLPGQVNNHSTTDPVQPNK